MPSSGIVPDMDTVIAAGERWIKATMDDMASLAAALYPGITNDVSRASNIARKKAAEDFGQALDNYVNARISQSQHSLISR